MLFLQIARQRRHQTRKNDVKISEIIVLGNFIAKFICYQNNHGFNIRFV